MNKNYVLDDFISSIDGYKQSGSITKYSLNDITYFQFWILSKEKIVFKNFEVINERNIECIPTLVSQKTLLNKNYFEIQNQFQNNVCYLVISKNDFEKGSGVLHDVFGTIVTMNKTRDLISSQSLIVINLFIAEDYFSAEKCIRNILQYGNDTTGLPKVRVDTFEENKIVNKLLYVNAEKEVVGKTQIGNMGIYNQEAFILSLKTFCHDKNIGIKSLTISKKNFFDQEQINSFSIQAINILLNFNDDIEVLNQLFKSSKLKVSDKNLIRKRIFISCYNMLFDVLSTKDEFIISSEALSTFKELLVKCSVTLSKTLDIKFANTFNANSINDFINTTNNLNMVSIIQTINTNTYKSKYNNVFYNINNKLQFISSIKRSSNTKEIRTLSTFSKVCFRYSKDLEESFGKDLFDFSVEEISRFLIVLQNKLPNTTQFSIFKTILKKYYKYFNRNNTPTYEYLCTTTEYKIVQLKNTPEYINADESLIKNSFKNSYDFFSAISYLHKNATSFRQHQFIFYTLVALHTKSILDGYLLPIQSLEELLYTQATIEVTIKENTFTVNALEDYKELISDCVKAYQKANFENENAVQENKEPNIFNSPNFNNTSIKQVKEKLLREERVIIGEPFIQQFNNSGTLPYIISPNVILLFRNVNAYMIKAKFDKVLELINRNNIIDKKEIIDIIKNTKNISTSKTPYTLFRAYLMSQLTSFGEPPIID